MLYHNSTATCNKEVAKSPSSIPRDSSEETIKQTDELSSQLVEEDNDGLGATPNNLVGSTPPILPEAEGSFGEHKSRSFHSDKNNNSAYEIKCDNDNENTDVSRPSARSRSRTSTSYSSTSTTSCRKRTLSRDEIISVYSHRDPIVPHSTSTNHQRQCKKDDTGWTDVWLPLFASCTIS